MPAPPGGTQPVGREPRDSDQQFGDAIKGGSGLGALEYVLVRHRRVWDENAVRIDSLIREEYLNIASRSHTRTQRLREFNDCIPEILAKLASWERIEIRSDLRVERLARIAPHDQIRGTVVQRDSDGPVRAASRLEREPSGRLG
jgi:hypothetical protein